MDLFRALLQTFQLQMITTGSSVPTSNCAPVYARNSKDLCDADCVVFVDATHPRATYAARPEGNRSQRRWPSKTAVGLPAAYGGGRRQPQPFIPPPPTNPHRQRTAPPMLHPIFKIARHNRREGQRSLSANDARLWHDESPAVPLWASYMRRANEVAREMCAPSKWERGMSLAWQFTTFLPHARTADERGELCGLFDGNRCGAIDPTAVRQDAAVYVGNGSNSAGHGDSGATKNCGAIGDEAGAPPDEGRDGSIYPQPDRLEGTCCLTTRVDSGESFV
ncbi:hypothetical protein TCDM_13240 [Trypanosoma cruzi Dm28c]|uniref:Uncharacterized protein n=1 Tax=Trypanosoma cruzi Dm28c TaxID=1416333 RepID=V5AT76_TRYCR|nr:hypothetical protein TCDM_13240 [Trypanosoma cruzi Dm28c]